MATQQALFLLTFQFIYMLIYPFYTSIFINQCGSTFRSDTITSRYVIRRITHQTKNIDYLFHPLDPEMIQYFRNTPHFRLISGTSRFIHEHSFANQLGVIFIRRDHIYLKPFFLSSFGQRTDHVVRLKPADNN